MKLRIIKKLLSVILVSSFLFGSIQTAVSVQAETAVSDSIAVLDDEAGETIYFTNITSEKSKVGSKCYATVPFGSPYRESWIMRGNLHQVLDISSITAGGTSGALRFWVYVEDRDAAVASWNGSQVQLGQGWDVKAYVWSNWDSQLVKDGWNEIILPFKDAGLVNEPDSSVITYINIRTNNIYYETDVYVDAVTVTATSARDEFAFPEDYKILNPCEKAGNLHSFGNLGICYDKAYEGSASILSPAEGTDTFILCSDGYGALEATDITPYLEKGALRMMVYVDDINGMGEHYRMALLSEGSSRSHYWANESGRNTETSDVGYFWDSALISSQITKNGWNELVLPFSSATQDIYISGNTTVYPYSEGVELTEIFFRNFSRSSDVYIDSIMLIDDISSFETKDVYSYKLSSFDEQKGRYVEGEGATYFENVSEYSVSFPRTNLTNYKNGYLRMKIYMSEVSSVPSVGGIDFMNTDTFVFNIPMSQIAPQLSIGWNEVVLRIEDIATVNRMVFKGVAGTWDKLWIDSAVIVTAFGEDFSKECFSFEQETDNISGSSDFNYRLLNSCETNSGFTENTACADYASEGSKSLKSGDEYILSSNGTAPLSPFSFTVGGGICFKLYIDGEISDIGDNLTLYITDKNGVANSLFWDSEDILPQLFYAHGWNTVTLPFAEAQILGNGRNITFTDIYFKSDNRKADVYTDTIAYVSGISFTETAAPFKRDVSGRLLCSFEGENGCDDVYHGAYSLMLSSSESRSFNGLYIPSDEYASGGISLMLYWDGATTPDGKINAYGKEWKLSESISRASLKKGWNKIYLSFESGSGSFNKNDNTLSVSAQSELCMDMAVLLSGFGDTAKEYRYSSVLWDANADEYFDIKDLVRLKASAAGIRRFYKSVSDSNKNGIADSEDIKDTRKALLGFETAEKVTPLSYDGGICAVGSEVAVTDVITFGAEADGVTDDTAAFKSALSYASSVGGTVYVPFGEYVIKESLYIPENVTLLGEIKPNGDKPILKVYTKTVKQGNNTAFINLLYGSTVKGFRIYYPEQTLQNGVAKQYPYTIKMVGWQSVCIEDMELINSFDGIDLSLAPHNLETVRNVRATVLGTGMLWYGNNDTGRFDNIEFSPDVWLESGVDTIPDSTLLCKWTRKNTVGIRMLSIDWHYAARIRITDCKTGVLVEGGFGKFFDTEILRANKGIVFENVAYYGTTLTNCTVSATHGAEPRAVSISESAANSLAFAGSDLSSVGDRVIDLKGTTSVTLTDCTVSASDSGEYAVYNQNGSFAAVSTVFSGGGKTVNATSGRTNKFAGCSFDGIASPDKLLCEVTKAAKEISVPEIEQDRYELKDDCTKGFLLNAADFGVSGESENVAEALQDVIDLAFELGGGTVYVPTGDYKLNSPVTVKSGVTLLGSYDNPHYSAVRCTAFVTDYGKNDPDGTALITLESGSSIRGFSVAYGNTRLDGTPYAYTLRGKGSDIYISNVTVDGAYRVLDMSSYRCDNHYVEYLLFSAFDIGISVGAESRDGVIRDCHSNPAQLWDNRFTDRGYWLETVGTSGIISSLNSTFDAYVISNTVNQMMYMNFVYSAKTGVWVKDDAEVMLVSQGVDYTLEALKVSGNAKITAFDAQLSCSAGGSVAVVADSSFKGELKLYDVTVWACTANAVDIASGNVDICGGVFFQCANHAITAAGGNICICGVSVVWHNLSTFELASSVNFSEFANLYSMNKTVTSK